MEMKWDGGVVRGRDMVMLVLVVLLAVVPNSMFVLVSTGDKEQCLLWIDVCILCILCILCRVRGLR